MAKTAVGGPKKELVFQRVFYTGSYVVMNGVASSHTDGIDGPIEQSFETRDGGSHPLWAGMACLPPCLCAVRAPT